MKLAILSDIHSNLEALDAVLEVCKDHQVDKYVCLGDVVGYGADVNACCDIIRELCDFTLLGNHDAAVIGAMEESYYYQEAKDAIHWTRENLSEENISWLFSLPYTAQMDELSFYHGAPLQPSGFLYLVHAEDARMHLEMFGKLNRWNFVGHAHLTESFLLSGDTVRDISGKPVTPGKDEKALINVGSVGQPRDRNPDACMVILDTDKEMYEHVRVPYDIDGAAKKIQDAGLSSRFSDRLHLGI
jgi:diadenosine tetraphosphatase ApaH/serine/threonine PP2A family protein phosphatase